MNYKAATEQSGIKIPGLPLTEEKRLLYSPLMYGLAPELQKELIGIGHVKSLKRGGLLFMAGDPVGHVYCLLSGKLKEYYSTITGDICLRKILMPGSCISMHMVFTGQETYPYTGEAVKAVRYFTWPAKRFMKLAAARPELSLQAARVLSAYAEETCRLHCICRKHQAVSRVAGYLLRQCSPDRICPAVPGFCPKARCPRRANIRPLELTANDICLARETFSRALSSLQDKKIIRMESGEVEIIDEEALKDISGM
ncbi:MAG: Crp/Fnr family transcriptional regulator [Desulfobacter sp.]|nr:MAG: Crp/Fnr family transcriptional regulator [Desulfobacter sp.]